MKSSVYRFAIVAIAVIVAVVVLDIGSHKPAGEPVNTNILRIGVAAQQLFEEGNNEDEQRVLELVCNQQVSIKRADTAAMSFDIKQINLAGDSANYDSNYINVQRYIENNKKRYPHLNQIMQGDLCSAVNPGDGVYVVPGLNFMPVHSLLFRDDIAERLNIKPPATMDEFLALRQAMGNTNYLPFVCMIDSKAEAGLHDLGFVFRTCLSRYGLNDFDRFCAADSRFETFETEDAALKSLLVINKMYREKILTEDSFDKNVFFKPDVYGRALVLATSRVNKVIDVERKRNFSVKYSALSQFKTPERIQPLNSPLASLHFYVIPKSCDKPEAALDFLEKINTPAVQNRLFAEYEKNVISVKNTDNSNEDWDTLHYNANTDTEKIANLNYSARMSLINILISKDKRVMSLMVKLGKLVATDAAFAKKLSDLEAIRDGWYLRIIRSADGITAQDNWNKFINEWKINGGTTVASILAGD